MPRNRALFGTDSHPRDTGSFVPYLNSFSKLLQPSEYITKTNDLLYSYLGYISVRCGKTNENKASDLISQAKSGFRRAFRKLAIQRNWRESSKPRGYYVQLSRVSRETVKSNTYSDAEEKVLCQKIFIDKKIGYGLFAACDIPKDYIVIKYRGQWINKAENEERETYYEKNGFVPVSVHDPITGMILDANRDEKGVMFESHENIGRYANHSKVSPNCQLASKQNSEGIKHLYIITLNDIPKGAQLLWDYGDNSQYSVKSNPWLKL